MKSRKIVIGCLVFLLVVSCKPRQPEGTPQSQTKSGQPVTVELLSLMPDTATSVVVFPSIKRTYNQVETFLLNASPENINMEAELKVVLSQLARLAEVYDAATVEEIALAKGIDPEEPVGLYFAATTAGQPPQPAHELLRAIGFNTVPPFAAVFTIANRQDAEHFVADWSGPSAMVGEDLQTPRTTIFTREDPAFGYFFTDTQLVAGTSPQLVKEIAQKMAAPDTPRYGTAECPADSNYEVVQLIRTDRLAAVENATTPGVLDNVFPRRVRQAAGDAWSGWLADYNGADPMVVTWNFEETRATVRARLDYSKHPQAQQRLENVKPLTHINLIPSDALAMYSIEVTPRMREGFKEMTAKFVGEGGELVSQINSAFGQLIDTAGDEATFAVLDSENASNVIMLVEFQDGDVTRAKMRELGLAPIVAETYNNIEIYSLILPAPVPIYYALPKNTLVAANSVDIVKTLIDSVNSGKPTRFAASLEPPVTPDTPRRQLFVARKEVLTDALLPVLVDMNQIQPDRTNAVIVGAEKIRDVRLSTEVLNNWQDTRLIVQVGS